MLYSDYLHCAIDLHIRKKIINKAVIFLRKQQKTSEFTGVAFRGVSGALIAPSIADKLRCDLLVVRKKDGSHSSCEIEGNLTDKYIIIDDFVRTGETLRIIVDKIRKYVPESKCVGVYFYYPKDVCTGWFTNKEHVVSKIQEWIQNDTAQVWLEGAPTRGKIISA